MSSFSEFFPIFSCFEIKSVFKLFDYLDCLLLRFFVEIDSEDLLLFVSCCVFVIAILLRIAWLFSGVIFSLLFQLLR